METLIGASCPGCGALSGMCRCDTLQENTDLKAKVAELEAKVAELKALVGSMETQGVFHMAQIGRLEADNAALRESAGREALTLMAETIGDRNEEISVLKKASEIRPMSKAPRNGRHIRRVYVEYFDKHNSSWVTIEDPGWLPCPPDTDKPDAMGNMHGRVHTDVGRSRVPRSNRSTDTDKSGETI